MIAIELEQVEIDHCPTCGGVWLDEGELELLLGKEGRSKRMLGSAKPDRKEKTKKCPICLRRMEHVLLSGIEPVRADKCRLDHGLWFDRGELETVVRGADVTGGEKIGSYLRNVFRQKMVTGGG